METTKLRTERPWGWFESLDQGSDPVYKVKTIFVKPNQQFSLQYHNHRREHWVVVQGEGSVTVDNMEKVVKRGDYIFVDYTQIHRMKAFENGIKFVEVQHGLVCEEADIVRISDDYGRK
jgi:mannose-6-phosphate isomerase